MFYTVSDFMKCSNNRPVYLECYEAIKNAIICGMLSPGDPILETDLSRELKVSRTPIRQAFAQLEIDGLIIANMDKPGMIVKGLGADGITRMYTIQANIEQMILPLALTNIMREDIVNLEKIQGKLESSNAEGKSYQAAKYNEEFHRTIFGYSGFPGLVKAINWIYGFLNVFNILGFSQKARSAMVIHENRIIIQAIKRNDPQFLLDLYENNISVRQSYVLQQYHEFIEAGKSKSTEDGAPDERADGGE